MAAEPKNDIIPAPQNAIVTPPSNLEDVKKAWKQWNEYLDEFLKWAPEGASDAEKKLADGIYIQGAPFIKKPGCDKLSFAANLSDEITLEKREPLLDLDGKTVGFTYTIWVKVIAWNGRSTVQPGVAASNEDRFIRKGKDGKPILDAQGRPLLVDGIDHRVYSTAHTRARDRGVRTILGLAIRSAEEPNGDVQQQAAQPAGPGPAPAGVPPSAAAQSTPSSWVAPSLKRFEAITKVIQPWVEKGNVQLDPDGADYKVLIVKNLDRNDFNGLQAVLEGFEAEYIPYASAGPIGHAFFSVAK